MAQDISADQPFDHDDDSGPRGWVSAIYADLHPGMFIRATNRDKVTVQGEVAGTKFTAANGNEVKIGRNGNMNLIAAGWTFEVLK